MTINTAVLTEADASESGVSGLFVSPPMTIERYANLAGLTEATVEHQVKRGQLPTIKRGKRRLINTYALAHECLVDQH